MTQADSDSGRGSVGARGGYQLLAIAGLVVTVVLLIAAADNGNVRSVEAQAAIEQTASFSGQGGVGPLYAQDAALLLRDGDGIGVEVAVPTPEPGSYEYPQSDEVAPWATPHPDVAPATNGEPEAFTLWAFVFNYPELCTENMCDLDDIGADTAALGGGYQVDGRIADSNDLVFSGRLRLGQPPASGATLENPLGAEVHVAIAPHGQALKGADRWRQLNGPVGNPSHWWAVTFLPPDE